MSLLRNVASGIRSLFSRKQVDRELGDELATYLEMRLNKRSSKGSPLRKHVGRCGSKGLSRSRKRKSAPLGGNRLSRLCARICVLPREPCAKLPCSLHLAHGQPLLR